MTDVTFLDGALPVSEFVCIGRVGIALRITYTMCCQKMTSLSLPSLITGFLSQISGFRLPISDLQLATLDLRLPISDV